MLNRCPTCNCEVCKCNSSKLTSSASIGVAMVKAFQEENARFKAALEEIRDVAQISEGVEFYAMLADKALKGEA